MPHRINEDHKKFRDVISGNSRQELKRLIKSGAIIRRRPKGGKMSISIPQIDIPHFVFGDTGEGVGKGPGKEGDIIGRDPQPGNGQSGAGDSPGEGITITVDMDSVLKFMENELKLPRMKPKPNETFDEIKIKYNNISRIGLNSLRHIRRTMKEALKRTCAMGTADELVMIPGSDVPVKVVTPIKSDFRFRQYKQIKYPSSNAVIFFARDCSGSMDAYRCDIVSDMSWWIDCWIRKFYKRVDRCYFVHDTKAAEVDEEQFYKYRYGGGTQCSSAFEAISEQLVNRYPPNKFNIYVFYFTDGDNYPNDTQRVVEIMKTKLGPNVVNMIGVTQICPWNSGANVKTQIDESVNKGELNSEHVKTISIAPKKSSWGITTPTGSTTPLTEDDRNQQILEGIKKLLSSKKYIDSGA